MIIQKANTINELNYHLESIANLISEELFKTFLLDLEDKLAFVFKLYVQQESTNQKIVHLIIICSRESVEFITKHGLITDYYIKMFITPKLSLTNSSPLRQFIRFYENNRNKFDKLLRIKTIDKQYSGPLIKLDYNTQYGSIKFSQYPFLIGDSIIKLSWMLPDTLELLKLCETHYTAQLNQ